MTTTRLARESAVQRVVYALAGLSWLVLAWRAPWSSVGGFSGATAVVASVWGWLAWFTVAVAVLVASPASLTIVRLVVPIAVVASVVDADPIASAVAALALVVSTSGTFSDAMVQGGAYGDERRFCLRTPVPQMAPATLAWALLVSTTIGGSLVAAEQVWLVAVPLVAAGAALAWLVPVRLHRLSRRWLVLVPAGVVVHDHLVLGETIMVKRHGIASVSIAATPGEAFDLTGGTAGPRLEVALRSPEKVIVSDLTARVLGINGAAHVSTFAIAAKRTGAAYSALSR
ncbi:MAG: hypothetical protein ACO3RB_03840 [Ilumatobacteraceae bacterium]